MNVIFLIIVLLGKGPDIEQSESGCLGGQSIFAASFTKPWRGFQKFFSLNFYEFPLFILLPYTILRIQNDCCDLYILMMSIR